VGNEAACHQFGEVVRFNKGEQLSRVEYGLKLEHLPQPAHHLKQRTKEHRPSIDPKATKCINFPPINNLIPQSSAKRLLYMSRKQQKTAENDLIPKRGQQQIYQCQEGPTAGGV